MWRLLLGLIVVTSCSSSPEAAFQPPVSPPVASPSPARSGVLAAVSGPDDVIRLMGSDGAVVASAPSAPARYRQNFLMPWFSATQTRVYFLYGGSDVRYLTPRGETGSITRVTLAPNQQAGISVSPDDRRIAVAILNYTPPPGSQTVVNPPTYDGMRLYVEDLHGGGHHADIFASTEVAEFPIGWINGRLVMAVSSPVCCQLLAINPYGATSYHVIDPANGVRLADLCPNSLGPVGPVEPIGTACWDDHAEPRYQRWDGSPFPTPTAMTSPFQYLNALSPDGTRVAAGGAQIRILRGGQGDDQLGEGGFVYGWLDDSHLIYEPVGGTIRAFDLFTRTSVALDRSYFYLGAFPAAIS